MPRELTRRAAPSRIRMPGRISPTADSTSRTSSAVSPLPIRRMRRTTPRMPRPISSRSPAPTRGYGRNWPRLPADQRKVVSSHDAFGYFAAAYGVEFMALQGISEDAEPSAADLKQLIDQIRARAHQGPVLRERSQPAPDRANRAGDRRQGRRHALCGCIVAGRAGPPPRYLGMFRHNVPLLRDAMLASGVQN